MKYIICVDNNMGIKFNNRRISKDIEIIKDIINYNNYNIKIDDASIDLFQYYQFDINKLKSTDNSYVFIEKDILDCEEIIIYNFNRKYPSDLKLTLNLNNYILMESIDIKGNSHQLITRKRYKKRLYEK